MRDLAITGKIQGSCHLFAGWHHCYSGAKPHLDQVHREVVASRGWGHPNPPHTEGALQGDLGKKLGGEQLLGEGQGKSINDPGL